MTVKKYKNIVIGGTFDRLHKGHRTFLAKAFKLGEKVLIGVTSDKYAAVKGRVTPYRERVEFLKSWLAAEKLLTRALVFKLEDVYGPKIFDNRLEAILVTENTRKGAELVNQAREKSGLRPLIIEKQPLIMALDRKIISSERIRLGEIDREGYSYVQYKFSGGYLPEALRPHLQKPLGYLIKGRVDEPRSVASRIRKIIKRIDPPLVIVVGDVITKMFNEEKIPFQLSLIDLKVNREKIYHSLSNLGFQIPIGRKASFSSVVTLSRAGFLSRPLFQTIRKSLREINKYHGQQVIYVKGEEDLSVLPVVFLAPLNSLIFYGQPHRISEKGEGGVVAIRVDEETKKSILVLLQQFKKKI